VRLWEKSPIRRSCRSRDPEILRLDNFYNFKDATKDAGTKCAGYFRHAERARGEKVEIPFSAVGYLPRDWAARVSFHAFIARWTRPRRVARFLKRPDSRMCSCFRST